MFEAADELLFRSFSLINFTLSFSTISLTSLFNFEVVDELNVPTVAASFSASL